MVCLTLLSNLANAVQDTNFDDALASSSRFEQDQKSDAGRKPNNVLEFLNIEPGMRVLDLAAYAGYYTEVLSLRVGEKGEVVSHNSAKFYKPAQDNYNQRIANNRLANVTTYTRDISEIDLDNEVDAIVFMRAYHEYCDLITPERAWINVLKSFHKALKPGGIIGIIDHQERPGPHNSKIHRISGETVKLQMVAAGFTFVAESHILRNTEDDFSKVGYDSSMRNKTDRFLFKFRK